MTNLTTTRHELKYYISPKEAYVLVARLKHILSPDRHSIPGKGYFVRSLYFDSHDDEALFEKQSGIQHRVKYRMRTYDIHAQILKFEIKSKHNNQIHKQSAAITKAVAQQVLKGNYEALLAENNPILNHIFAVFQTKAYTPKVLIDYERDAYLFPIGNVRITIDKHVHSSATQFDIFSNHIHVLPVILEQKYILEIKYEGFLPDFIKGVLQIDASERMAISKYALSRRYFKTHTWEDN